MKNSSIKIWKLVFIICVGIIALGGCVKDKETIISDNVEKDIQIEESQINKYIQEGNKYLSEGKYDEAKASYEAATEKSKSYKLVYIDIKDEYLKYKRYDDAYAIIKLAIENNVDVENMKSILKSIQENFESVIISKSVYQDESYELPEQVEVKINNKIINDYVTWNENSINTSVIGMFSYEGITKEHGKNIKVNLEVKENSYSRMVGFIHDLYKSEEGIYISFDEAEFYKDAEALAEARKLGKGWRTEEGEFILTNTDGDYGNNNVMAATEEDKNFRLLNGYFIKNPNKSLVTYTVDRNAIFKMLDYEVDPSKYYSIDLVKVNYDTIRAYIDSHNNESSYSSKEEYKKYKDYARPLLYWIDIKNGIVVNV
ncbi:MAG: Ig-like domain-containing protein [Clostridium sp.]